MLRLTGFLLVAAIFVRMAPAMAAVKTPASTDGKSLGVFAPHIDPAGKDAARIDEVAAAGPGFSRAWAVATLRDAANPAAIELRLVNEHPVAAGGVALVRFFARTTVSSDEAGSALVLLVAGPDQADGNRSYEGDFPLTRDWQEISVPFVWTRDFAPGEAVISLRFGFKRQTVEIGGLEAIDYGRTRELASLPRTRFTYVGREANAPWRQAALARIEKIRKGDFAIRVVDAAGRPVRGAKITVTETRAAFDWGTALQMRRLVVDTPDNLRYRKVAQALFNAASTENDLKWPVWIGEWDGDYSRAQTLAGLHWLKDRGFRLRGHVFVWPGAQNLPQLVQNLVGTPRQGEIPDLVLAHIREEARTTNGLLEEWDVLNEPFTNHELMDIFGDQIMPPWFKVAREELPQARLYLNDFSNHDFTTDAEHVANFEKTAHYLLDHGAPLGGLGLQAHFNGRPNAPANVLATLDRYAAEFDLPMRFTEFDINTYDEQLQADYTRDFLILAFSHPRVVGVQLWGFWAEAHWRPAAAMYRSDWSEKPNAEVYKNLVLHQWRTHLAAATDPDGRYAARGFYGDYRVIAECGGKKIEQTFSLKAGGAPPVIKVTLP